MLKAEKDEGNSLVIDKRDAGGGEGRMNLSGNRNSKFSNRGGDDDRK